MDIRENVLLAPFTTLGVGGPARFFAEASNEDDVADAFSFARERGLKVFVLGGGSNIVVADEGFDGLVMRVALRGIEVSTDGAVKAAAGEDWDPFVERCVSRRLAGVECLSGIQGTVGGTPVQNVGAYGQEVSETLVGLRCFDREAHEFREMSAAECGFSYRRSIFNTTLRDRFVITSVSYHLTPGGSAKVAYKDLKEKFGVAEAGLRDVREEVLRIRRAKSMVIDAADANSRSVGSFFKNPIVSEAELERIARISVGDMPIFPASDGFAKLSAAWLIEKAGFSKGFSLGRAGISENHSLAIVNRGGAEATEIHRLKELIQTEVRKRFGVELTPEPIFVGP